MGTDTYDDFRQLAANEVLDRDYRIEVRDLGVDITIMAPHGGCIEPNTSAIAREIADDVFNCYCFEGMKSKGNRALHITSHRFDEPQALELISKSSVIVAIHACKDTQEIIYIGGLFKDLIHHIQKRLELAGMLVSMKLDRFAGINPNNICNKGISQKGVQLEVSRGLRDRPDKIHIISKTVRDALKTWITGQVIKD